ncbi:hypothetical protein DM860_003063 [Cuscuta australis]|uniref:Bifunctional inhibitor/plant lipid transfer protein/seed storage helical domain-containing protein n=1 Tax=Cuscuta australis TaxID=267555 RepID=A0A328D369_9ASTE|nr:hypothetical protein DM860_003063 [Cuscuta australis]
MRNARRVLGAIFVGMTMLWSSSCFEAAGDTNQTRNANQNECLNKLVPCLNYLNESQGPPSRCCDPLKEMIQNMPACLCQMVSIRGSNEAEKAGIDMNEAQMLPARCGLRVNYFGCVPGITKYIYIYILRGIIYMMHAMHTTVLFVAQA